MISYNPFQEVNDENSFNNLSDADMKMEFNIIMDTFSENDPDLLTNDKKISRFMGLIKTVKKQANGYMCREMMEYIVSNY